MRHWRWMLMGALGVLVFWGVFALWPQGKPSQPVVRSELVIGLIDDTPPFAFYNAQNQLVGVNIDIVTEIARRLGKKPRIESVTFNRLTSGLMRRQYDLVSIGSITPHRAKMVRYVTPHYVTSDVLIVHPPLAKLQSIDGLKGSHWKIGVYNGTSYIQLLKDMGLASNMVIYPNQRDVFLAFYKHRCDAIIMNEHVAEYLKTHVDPQMVIVPKPVRKDREFAYAIDKENLVLWRDVNRIIQTMHQDGTLDRIHTHWFSKSAGWQADVTH